MWIETIFDFLYEGTHKLKVLLSLSNTQDMLMVFIWLVMNRTDVFEHVSFGAFNSGISNIFHLNKPVCNINGINTMDTNQN